MSSFANISIRFSADLKQFSTQLDNAKRQLKSTGEQFKKVGAGLTVGLTAPLIALGAKSFSVFADFEDQLAKVKAISGATTQQFDALRKNAEALGASTRFTASEVAELQLNLSKLGFNPDEINATTAGVLDLALATGEDLANSAAVAAGTLRAFGLGVGETQRVVDVMAKSFGSSALDLERFKTAMGVVGPVAKTAGVELEKATAQLGILINSNVDASTAGTSLRNIYLTLAETGLTYNQALDKIATSTNKNATALQLFGKRGATAAVILADNKDEVNALGIELDNAAGAAKAMSKIMDNTSKGSLARLKSAFESLFIAVGDKLAPLIRDISDFVANIASRFRELSPETQKLIVVIGALSAALGPLLVVIGLMVTNVLPGLIAAFAATGSAFGVLATIIAANPIGALLTVVGLAAAAFIAFGNSTKETIAQQTILAEVTDTASKSIANERAKLSELLFKARDEKLAKEQRIKAIKELNKLSPKYLGDLTLEKINTDEARKALDLYNDSLIKTALVKAAQAKLVALQSKIIDEELAGSKARQTTQQNEQKLAEQGLSVEERAALQRRVAIAGIGEELNVRGQRIAKLREEEQAILAIINANAQLNGSVSPTPIGTPSGSSNEDVDNDLSLKTVSSLTTDGVVQLGDALDDLKPKLAIPVPDEAFMRFLNGLENIKITAQAVGGAVGQAFSGFTSRIVDSLNLANDGFEGFVKGLADTVTQLIAQLLAASISQSIAGATASGTATGPAAVVSTPAFIATAVGGVLAAFAAIPKFADGGIAYGPTLGLMGEYAGARNNPEVIAPLNKLKDIIGGTTSDGGFAGTLTADGNNLAVVIDRTNDRNKRLG